MKQNYFSVPRLAIALFVLFGLTIHFGCGDDASDARGEGSSCAAPSECSDGYDCLEGQCQAVENDDCDCPARTEQCVDGQCQQIEVVTVDFRYDDDQQNTSGSTTTICPRRPVHDEPVGSEVLLEDDECTAFRSTPGWEPTHETFALDMGAVTLRVNGDEPVELSQVESEPEFLAGCYDGFRSPEYAAGDSLELNIPGGDDFPELTIEATIPPQITPQVDTFVPGEPLQVQWVLNDEDATSDPDAVSIVISTEDGDDIVFVGCSAADDGKFTIPAAFTDLLPQASSDYRLSIRRRDTFELNPEGTDLPVSVRAQSETTNMPLSVQQ